MSFLSPLRLWLLVLPAALAVAYVVAQRTRRRHAVRFTNVALLASVAPRRPGWRRHVPAALVLAALAALAVGVARPAREVRVPREQATVVLALDVSRSMAAADVSPDRLTAAQEAARRFVRALPQPLRLGLVAFDGSARLQVAPTEDRTRVLQGIDALTLGPGTAIGEAILTGVEALVADAPPAGGDDGDARPAAHLVVMSDGSTTMGRSNEEAVAEAERSRIPVTTIAYGTDTGFVEVEGTIVPVPVDREALRSIAEATAGHFFEAADAGELRRVYDDIGRVVGYDVEQRELTVWLTGAALALTAVAAAASLLWMARLP